MGHIIPLHYIFANQISSGQHDPPIYSKVNLLYVFQFKNSDNTEVPEIAKTEPNKLELFIDPGNQASKHFRH
jgi:hypothetical protein